MATLNSIENIWRGFSIPYISDICGGVSEINPAAQTVKITSQSCVLHIFLLIQRWNENKPKTVIIKYKNKIIDAYFLFL